MPKLPLLISVPHAGLKVPPEVEGIFNLTSEEIASDGDVGAAEIYSGLAREVESFVSTDIARAAVDMNRAPDDFSRDGVIKTHTCYNQPVYKTPPDKEQCRILLQRYYHPYHRQLVDGAKQEVLLAIDCHTMAAFGPPVGPDPGEERPLICLSNGEGTCSTDTLHSLAACFARAFDCRVSLNHPFRGGFICRSHSREMPWIQLEMSRTGRLTSAEKAKSVRMALHDWCASL